MADGSLCFVDRRKNVIRRSGENISAVEVESVLMQHPAIRAVAVAAAPDPVRGDEVLACIVPRDELPDLAERERIAAEIVGWVSHTSRLLQGARPCRLPRGVPLTSTQKIQRGELKALAHRLLESGGCVDTRAMKKRSAG